MKIEIHNVVKIEEEVKVLTLSDGTSFAVKWITFKQKDGTQLQVSVFFEDKK